MPVCQNCKQEWSWVNTFKKLLKIKMICPNCKHTQYISSKSRKRISIVSSLPLVLWFPLLLLNVPVSIIFIAETIILITVIMILPFWVNLSNQEEALW